MSRSVVMDQHRDNNASLIVSIQIGCAIGRPSIGSPHLLLGFVVSIFGGLAGGVRAVIQRTTDGPKKVIPFAPAEKEPARADSDPVDRSGESIIALLEKAARTADEDCKRAMDLAHKLSIQLRAAEDRASQLQEHVEYFQDRAVRAENWMARIYKEIEEKFMSQRASKGS